MKVLIAVDGSQGSFSAVGQIGQVLSEKDAVALYCSPPEFKLSSASTDASVLARARQSLAEAIFEEARKRLPAPLQAGAETIVGKQDPRQGILAAAEHWSADVVGIGARGLGALERLLLGSVSRAVVHAARVPVWVARDKPFVSDRPINALLACENPELGRHAADVLGRFSWPIGTNLATICVVGSVFSGRVPDWLQKQARSPDVEAMAQAWAKEHDEELSACRARMEDFAKSLPAPLKTCRSLVVEGVAAREILAAIDREKMDLVVVGSHRKRSMVSTILGSTSEAVLNHATCSVLVVPHQEGA